MDIRTIQNLKCTHTHTTRRHVRTYACTHARSHSHKHSHTHTHTHTNFEGHERGSSSVHNQDYFFKIFQEAFISLLKDLKLAFSSMWLLTASVGPTQNDLDISYNVSAMNELVLIWILTYNNNVFLDALPVK